jgi:hypothetical protein
MDHTARPRKSSAVFWFFGAANYEEAIDLIRECPMLDDGSIELRQTDPMGCGGD